MGKQISFFLGANTSNGFISHFDELYDTKDNWQAYIIKGGPGTGKSGLMKKIALIGEANNIVTERIYCSSDPDSLDAVIFPQIKVSFADGTSPHVVEPKYPGVIENIINLGEFWDVGKLRERREEIISATNRCSACHQRARRFLSASMSLQNDAYRLTSLCIDYDKINRYAARLIFREFGKASENTGKEKIRFLSAVTPKGYVARYDTFKALCQNVYVIVDNYLSVSSRLLSKIRQGALDKGFDIITCLNPFDPDIIDCIIIPDLELGFFTSNRMQNCEFETYKKVHSSRFMDTDKLKTYKQRIAFNRKASKELNQEAFRILKEAKKTHDELEAYYIDAMDFNQLDHKINKICNDFILKIKKASLN